MENIGVSVIMPSYLGEYNGSRKNAKDKFIRAVESFLNQDLKNKELIIVSDGCEITNQTYYENWKSNYEIRLIICEKNNATWPGELREAGRSLAKYEWITYLDSDDMILPHHLSIIYQAIKNRKKNTTVFFNTHYLMPLPKNPNNTMLAYVGLSLNNYKIIRDKCQTFMDHKIAIAKAYQGKYLGTWQITHYKYVSSRWRNTMEMGEDTLFANSLEASEQYEEYMGGYIMCHATNKRKHIWEI